MHLVVSQSPRSTRLVEDLGDPSVADQRRTMSLRRLRKHVVCCFCCEERQEVLLVNTFARNYGR